MESRNLKLTIRYDGTSYHGWQRQKNTPATVQQTLEMALQKVVNHPVSLRAAGRTDTGVHADGQVANFNTDCPIPDHHFSHAVNTRLPRDIRVIAADAVADDFDSTLSAKSKLYRYQIFNHDDMPPLLKTRYYHFWRPCLIAPAAEAAAALLGTHDFAAFASAGHQRKSTVRTLTRCHVWQKFHTINFDLEADGFLYHMVRNVVGTLLEIARGHWPAQRITEILESRNRARCGPTIPACGLTMKWVRY